jgi:hypothetical protein
MCVMCVMCVASVLYANAQDRKQQYTAVYVCATQISRTVAGAEVVGVAGGVNGAAVAPSITAPGEPVSIAPTKPGICT